MKQSKTESKRNHRKPKFDVTFSQSKTLISPDSWERMQESICQVIAYLWTKEQGSLSAPAGQPAIMGAHCHRQGGAAI